jgi:hypothetical protein
MDTEITNKVQETTAYELNRDKLSYGFEADVIFVYAKNINEAKTKLLDKVKYDGWILNQGGEELTYLNIPVRRIKKYDLFEFEDKYLSQNKIGEILKNRERNDKLDAIINDSEIKYCYIRKGAYYRPCGAGYTDFVSRAGVFTKEEAVSEAKSCQDLYIVPINIEEHNKMIETEIQDLQTRILK